MSEVNKARCQAYQDKNRQKRKMELVKCPICGREFVRLGNHLWQAHKMTTKEFRMKYGWSKSQMSSLEDRLKMRKKAYKNPHVIYHNLMEGGEAYRFQPGDKEHGRKVSKYWRERRKHETK